ncbi:MAG: hypothetical protein IIC52_00965 [Proteobacteria bacterium]|nr:hypothetical protein [Pseudomonadota bacterium]
MAAPIGDGAPIHCVAEGMAGMEALPSRFTAEGWADIAHLDFTKMPVLTDLIAGHAKGRQGADEVTCLINNFGLGIQFAAIGASVLDRAKEAGLGHQLPTEWFTQTVHP